VTDPNQTLLAVAIDEARLGAGEGGIPIGAALFHKDGRLLGRGHNRLIQEADPSVHGETDAFRMAGRQRRYRDRYGHGDDAGASARAAGGAARWLGGPATAKGSAQKPTGGPIFQASHAAPKLGRNIRLVTRKGCGQPWTGRAFEIPIRFYTFIIRWQCELGALSAQENLLPARSNAKFVANESIWRRR
jgi:hypothetical protein